ncbi:hypothetical protein HD554DRAFT_599694 [Boletus coccyginus]|nr:hypothetical protein HD554DRAFT_599694 [Boletus coccyginus]
MSTSLVEDIDFDKWSTLPNGTTVLAKNAPYIPCPVSDDEPPFPRADGSWGPHEITLLPQPHDHEHPYLVHILVEGHDCFRLPRSVTCHRFKDSDFYRYPPLPRRGHIKETVVSAWKDEIDSYRCRVLHLYGELQTAHPGPYKAPTIAIGRAEDTIFIITHNIMSYRDAVEYTRGLQRFVAEIQAFIIWGNNILGRSLMDHQPVRQCFRGAYVTSSTDFEYLSSFGVPVFYLTALSSSELPPSRYVHITELTSLCEFRTWTDIDVMRHQKDVIKGKLLHSKPLMFYPPHVDRSDPLAFERAARGYGVREDTMSFDRRLVIDSAIVNGRAHKSSVPRKPKPQESDWRRQVKSIREDWPSWGCDWDYFWHYHAVQDGLPQHTDSESPVPSHGAHFTYTVPPVHLLSNVRSDEKRAKVCFTWVCIRRIWLLRYQEYRVNHSSRIVATTNEGVPPSSFHLHTQTWRDVLSGHWWRKNSWPPQSDYDHCVFWRHGGPQLLGFSQEQLEQEQGDPADAYYSQSDDLSPLLSPGRRLRLGDFENKALCNMVVYDLALTNHKLQFEEVDDFLMHIDSMSLKDRLVRLEARRDLFRSSWDIPKAAFPWHDASWESTPNWKQAVPWYTRFCRLLSSWPRENDRESIDWDKDLSELDRWCFTSYSRSLVIFYRHTVFRVLGIAVAPLLRFPSVDTLDPIFFSM